MKPASVETALAGSSTPRRPSIASCLLILCVVKILLLTRGFAVTLRCMARLSDKGHPLANIDGGMVEAVGRRVASAAALAPVRMACLEQALAIYYLLRRQRYPVALRIGVQPFAFVAHAWVECAGRPVGEHRELLRKLVTFDELHA